MTTVDTLRSVSGVGARITRIRAEASKHVISPYTIGRAVERYEAAHGRPKPDFGQTSGFMGSVTNFVKGCETVSQTLFHELPPEPAAYIAVARSAFGSPFFEALADFCRQETGSEYFIHRVLGVTRSIATTGRPSAMNCGASTARGH